MYAFTLVKHNLWHCDWKMFIFISLLYTDS